MTVKEIVAEYLVNHGFDGLSNGNFCSCLVDDLMCCDSDSMRECDAAYRIPCDKSCGNDICDFHMVTEKPK